VVGNDNFLFANSTSRSGGTGMRVEGQNNVLDHNLVENSRLDGIALIGNGDGNPATIEWNSNSVAANGGSGISVIGSLHHFSGNQANTSGDDGIFVNGTTNRFTANVARENKGDGVFVTGGGNGRSRCASTAGPAPRAKPPPLGPPCPVVLCLGNTGHVGPGARVGDRACKNTTLLDQGPLERLGKCRTVDS
jgi:Right handed beta helix region